MSLLIVRFVNATEGLDTSVVRELGFDVEPSPNLRGAHVVVNDLPPTLGQWIAVAFMAFAMLTVLVVAVHHAKYNPATRHLIATCSIGIFASGLHNIDNILRPGTYFTPSWIVAPKLGLFPMDQGFLLWIIVLITGASSIQLLLSTRARAGHYRCIFYSVLLVHGYGCSIGIFHYLVQSPARFSSFAHGTILFEVIMGIVVTVVLGYTYREEAAQPVATYHPVPTTSTGQEADEAGTLVEMTRRTPNETRGASIDRKGLRLRSRSPKL